MQSSPMEKTIVQDMDSIHLTSNNDFLSLSKSYNDDYDSDLSIMLDDMDVVEDNQPKKNK